MTRPADPDQKYRDTHPLSPGAVIVEGVAHNGRACRLIDNTGGIARAELDGLLAALVAERKFGLRGLSSQGGSGIALGVPEFSHIQLGDDIYRLIILTYEARIERF